MKMSDSMQKLNDTIEHYKRQISRATESNDNDKIMRYILKLSRLHITVQNLQKTGIGRVVNSLRKYDGDIGESAKSLVIQWKNVVKIEESENFYQRDENSDEENQELSSTNDNEELQINQSITSSVASTSYYGNAPEISDGNNGNSDDHVSSHHRHHDKSKYKKSKKDKESKKRKESISNTTDDQEEGHTSKKLKKDHKYESVKNKKESEKNEITTTSRRDNTNHSEENIKKDKKSSHSDKKRDKHRTSHKSESKSHKHKKDYKSSHKDKSNLKKRSKDKTSDKPKEEYKPSTSSTQSTNNKTFEEALLGIEIGKKKQTKSKFRDRLSQSSSPEQELNHVPDSPELAPLNLDPEELIANYKPLPQLDVKKKKTIEDIDPLAKIMKTKNMRTKVYSGNKSTIYTEVPTLHDLCVKSIKNNLDSLSYTGGVPFEILEPILKYASPDQLYNLEHYNDYLIEDTGKLWEYHCQKEFRGKVPEKNEMWRDFYIRCLEERETKLAKLRKKVNANQAASIPVRKTILAYVNTAAKPPRVVAKKTGKVPNGFRY
ncbi:transcription elongation factor B polypeptide 3-like isoform X2 [Sipha flava]|uniref:Transcription elongation factor B polypeptide 3-like isoform X2 n=1 Tax=Sipha flava TaxID=143950 RepID=A0A8B8FDF5_9HEMI|nr:transcription elongation factor B polypeptide 3-like isoform X2 [Sipha flava]